MVSRRRRSALAAVLLLAPVGCTSLPIDGHIHDRSAEPRTTVQFENTDAARLFAEASKQDSNPDETDSHLLALLLHKRYVVSSDAARFNYAVGRCDTSGDHVITYAEAWYYWNLVK